MAWHEPWPVAERTLLQRFQHAGPMTWLLAAGAGWALLLWMAALLGMGGTVAEVSYERRLDEKRRTAITLDVTLPASVPLARVIEMLEHEDGVRRIHVSRPS